MDRVKTTPVDDLRTFQQRIERVGVPVDEWLRRLEQRIIERVDDQLRQETQPDAPANPA